MEVFGRIAFTENEVTLAIPGFSQFLQYALAILPPEDVQEGNIVQLTP